MQIPRTYSALGSRNVTALGFIVAYTARAPRHIAIHIEIITCWADCQKTTLNLIRLRGATMAASLAPSKGTNAEMRNEILTLLAKARSHLAASR